MVTYPLSLPLNRGSVSSRITMRSAIGSSESPFTFHDHVQVHQGQRWILSLTFPPMKASEYLDWCGFFGALNIKEGTFLARDTLICKPFGAATGSPVVDGDTDVRSPTLKVRGWTQNTPKILKRGDRFQLGVGINARYYQVTQDADSDASGRCELSIWPRLQLKALDGNVVKTDHPEGLFRMSSSTQSFERDGGRTTIVLDAVSVVAPSGAHAPIITTENPFFTADVTPEISGTASEEIVTVSIYLDGEFEGNATLVNGVWTYEFDELPYGSYVVTARGTNSDGVQSDFSAPLTMVIAPEWVMLGPDHQFPLRQSEWVIGQGWYDGAVYETPTDYLTAAGGVFTRGSDGTYFDEDGVMQIAGPNAPRLDHDVSSLAALGLRVEGQRTNYLRGTVPTGGTAGVVGSGGVMPTNWGLPSFPSGLTAEILAVGSNVADGIPGMSMRVSGSVSSNGAVRISAPGNTGNPAFNDSVTYTMSAYGKRVAGDAHNSRFNATLVNGGVDTPGVWDSTTPLRQARVSAVSEPPRNASGKWFEWRWGVRAANTSEDLTVMFGASQFEEGTYPSSYIHTTQAGGPVTRLADSLEYGASQGAGSVTVEARTAIGTDGVQTLWRMDNGTDDEVLEIIRDGDREVSAIVTVAGVPEVMMIAGVVADDTDLSVTFAWEAGRYALRLNGGAVATDTSYAGPLPAVDTEYEAYPDASLFGTVARVAYYPEAII